MKKRLIVLASLLVLSTMAFTACSQSKNTDTSSAQQSGTEKGADAQGDAAQAADDQGDVVQNGDAQSGDAQSGDAQGDAAQTADVEVTASSISDDEVAALDSATTVMLEVTDEEYISHVLLQFNQDVTDVKLWAVSADATADEIIKNDNVIAEAATVTADNKVVVSVQESETLPWNSISYKDASGKEHFMYLSWSGEDGHPFLTEYEPAE